MKSKAEPFTDIDDAGFRARLASRDDEAYTKFYIYYYPKIFKRIKRRCPDLNKEDIEDITNETLDKIPKEMKNFQYDGPGQFSSWVLTIGVNEAGTLEAKRRAEKNRVAGFHTQAGISQDPERSILLEELSKHFRRLPPGDRRILTDKFLLEMTFDQIARAQGKSQTKVKTEFSRAIERLKRLCGMLEKA